MNLLKIYSIGCELQIYLLDSKNIRQNKRLPFAVG